MQTDDGWLVRRRAELLRRTGFAQTQVIDPSTPFTVQDDITMWKRIGEFLTLSAELLTLDPPR